MEDYEKRFVTMTSYVFYYCTHHLLDDDTLRLYFGTLKIKNTRGVQLTPGSDLGPPPEIGPCPSSQQYAAETDPT